MSNRLGGRPGHENEDPDERHIGITVGHRLRADVDDADYRHEHPQVPEPADGQIPSSSTGQDEQGL